MRFVSFHSVPFQNRTVGTAIPELSGTVLHCNVNDSVPRTIPCMRSCILKGALRLCVIASLLQLNRSRWLSVPHAMIEVQCLWCVANASSPRTAPYTVVLASSETSSFSSVPHEQLLDLLLAGSLLSRYRATPLASLYHVILRNAPFGGTRNGHLQSNVNVA